MTIWPASVPVKVELCPAQRRATPNRIGATGARNWGKSRGASSSVAISWALVWKTAALRTRMAELTKNAAFRAMAESIRL
jgi:hypothetical protein